MTLLYLDVWDIACEFVVNDFPGYGSVVLVIVLLERHRVEFGANLGLPALFYVHINVHIHEYTYVSTMVGSGR